MTVPLSSSCKPQGTAMLQQLIPCHWEEQLGVSIGRIGCLQSMIKYGVMLLIPYDRRIQPLMILNQQMVIDPDRRQDFMISSSLNLKSDCTRIFPIPGALKPRLKIRAILSQLPLLRHPGRLFVSANDKERSKTVLWTSFSAAFATCSKRRVD
jgi:hypothetical protein